MNALPWPCALHRPVAAGSFAAIQACSNTSVLVADQTRLAPNAGERSAGDGRSDGNLCQRVGEYAATHPHSGQAQDAKPERFSSIGNDRGSDFGR
ncbi:hypothetical protein, partial [Xanthomonas translucens]|uniref:hypothetical protein n=1 Tax=Xanthomonas campestris pv. translucens TaxID=343 RepID=UPI001E5403A7